jgi:hypothetical protein
MVSEPRCLHRTRTHALVVGLAALALAAAAAAQTERTVRLTVYNRDLALVSDQRPLVVAAGTSQVTLDDVPARIDPTSVHLQAPAGQLQMLEQSFQYDLAEPQRVLQRYLDQPIEVALRSGEVRSGALLSFDGSQLVLRAADGGVSLLARDQAVDLRLPRLPEGLRTRPALVWQVQAPKAGAVPVAVSYLTGGLNWHAEYVAVANEADTRLDLSAWVSLENTSGATYPAARLQLIAGDVARIEPEMAPLRGRMVAMMDKAAPAAGFVDESFFEYHLYSLDRPTTIVDRETKQVALFPPTTAPITKVYEYDSQRDERQVRVVLETENRAENGLGMALPAGSVRVYKRDARGDLQFIGEDRLAHTPRHERLRLGVGSAFDVVGERREVAQERINDHAMERTVEVQVRNRKEAPVDVVAVEHLQGDWQIRQSTHPAQRRDAHTAAFTLHVAADDTTRLVYTVRERY